MHKSVSYVKPYAKMVLTKKMSLKQALDKVPWHMQNELLDYLRQHIKKSSEYFYTDDVYLQGNLIKSSGEGDGQPGHYIIEGV